MIETYRAPIHGNTRSECLLEAARRLEPLLGFSPFRPEHAAERGLDVEVDIDVSEVATLGNTSLGWTGTATATVRGRSRRR